MRAHHGSLSREQRLQVEDDLKAGRLPAMVATSSLELGIDMGAIDLVIQIEAPPSVASGLQRIGRGGHQAGAVSRGRDLPQVPRRPAGRGRHHARHARGRGRGDARPHEPARRARAAGGGDLRGRGADRGRPLRARPAGRALREAAARAARGRARHAVRPLSLRRVRGAAAAAGVGPPARHGARARGGGAPRRHQRRHHPRSRPLRRVPGRRRREAPSGTADGRRPGGRRVGELDEEMVFESRAGEVFVLGASSWRIVEIERDRVLVVPAPGEPGKMPFWKGDRPARPVELGRRSGPPDPRAGRRARARRRCARLVEEHDLDARAAENLLAYLAEQKEATGVAARRPHARPGADARRDGRLAAVPALALGRAACTRPGRWRCRRGCAASLDVDVETVWSDDGIVVRVPDREQPPDGRRPRARPGRDRGPGGARAGGQRALRRPLPRGGGAGPAPAAPAARPALAPLDAAQAGRRPAGGGRALRVVPHHPRDLPRVPAGRVRPARAASPWPPGCGGARSA